MTRFLLLCSLVVAATAGTARAQSQLPASITEQVSMTTTRDGNLILWIGDAQLSGGDGDNAWEFFADRIEFYVDESRLVATGSVVFMSGGARIAA